MNWYAFKTIPQREQGAHNAMTGAGITSLFAHEKVERQRYRHRRRSVAIVTTPILTGYALACHDTDELLLEWMARVFRLTMYGGAQRGTIPVVRSVVGTGTVPTPIPEYAIANLMDISGVVREMPRPRPITAGGKARIRVGPFGGAVCKVERVQGQRAAVLLGLFGSEVSVMVKTKNLEAA